MWTILSDLFANDDDQEVMSSVLVPLQDIAHFDGLASIRKFTEAAGSLDGGPLCTIFRMTPDERLAKLFNSLFRTLHRCIRLPNCCSCDPEALGLLRLLAS
jgi:hypothetical protein